MHPALWTSKTGLDAQQTNIDVISHNLANVNTDGFKRGQAVFEDLLYQKMYQPGGQTSQSTNAPSGLMLGTGVKMVATQKIFTPGNMISTGNGLDLAIDGQGFFQILRPDGTTAYTRAGNFQLDSQGQLVTPNGYTLSPAITIPTGTVSLTVGRDGTVSALAAGSSSPTTIGNIQLAYFINPVGLEPVGQNLFVETSSSGSPTATTPGTSGVGSLQQGMLEKSNVNVVEELVNLIQAQRAYEMNSKSISAIDQMLQYLNQTV